MKEESLKNLVAWLLGFQVIDGLGTQKLINKIAKED